MTKKILSILKYFVFLGLGVFLVWWQLGKLSEIQKFQFVESLRNAKYIYVLPVFIMAVLNFISRAMRWKLLLEPMQYHPSTSNTFYATMVGYFANTFVPRAGELMRCTMLTKYEKIPFTKLFGTVIIERLFDFVCYLMVIAITILVQIKTVKDFIIEKSGAIMAAQSSVPLWLKLSLLVVVILLFYFGTNFLLKNFSHLAITIKIKQIIKGLKEGAFTIIQLKKRKAFLYHSIFIWGTYLLQIYVGLNAMSETAHLGMGAALSILALSTFAMIIAPGGIGAFPVAVQQVLLIYSVHNISFGWFMWGVNTGIIILLGALSFALLHFQHKKKNENNPHLVVTTGV